jgi:hypothetical protein
MIWSVEHCSKTLAAVARLDRPKLIPTLLVHKCSCGIVIAYDAEEVEWAVTCSTRSLAMMTPDDRSIASLAEVCSGRGAERPAFRDNASRQLGICNRESV